MHPKIAQINIKPDVKNERGLPKKEIRHAFISKLGIEGDHNNFRSTKKDNTPDMAILIITMDIIDKLNKEGWPIKPGDLGENITIEGLDYSTIKPGQVFNIGFSQFEISFACEPCSTLKVLSYVGDEKINIFIKTLMNRRGWYGRVLKQGHISQYDEISKK